MMIIAIIEQFFQRVLNISRAEAPRVFYGWILRFFLKFGAIIGWTTVVAVTVTRFSISTLPLIFLVQALFTIAGMLLFSVLIDRLTAKQLLTMNGGFAIVTLLVSFFMYERDAAFLVFSLVASGLFLTQISILLSNYLEDFFTPLEAERIVPAVESAETVGGIMGGVVLATLVFSGFSQYLIFLWVLCLSFFLVALHFFTPKLPFYLQRLDKSSHTSGRQRMNRNGMMKSLHEIRRVPFLQILLVVLVFHWIIAHFIEFLYTKAVDETVHDVAGADHEASLAHGLGLLYIFFHTSALLVELFLSSRIIKSLGTFAGFMIHAVTLLLSGLSMLFGYGYVTAALARNNFEMTSIIQRNAYETSYYGFRHGTLRCMREFFEGFIFPGATILGTLLILGIEFFFLESHFAYIIPFMLISFTIAMGFFALQLQKRYTAMVMHNLHSSVPLARYHAIELISQKGHKDSHEHLSRLYWQATSNGERRKIITSLVHLGDIRSVYLLLKILRKSDGPLKRLTLESITQLGYTLRRGKRSEDVRRKTVEQLSGFIDSELDEDIRIHALRALAAYDGESAARYLTSPDPLLKAEAAACLWNMNLYHKDIRAVLSGFFRSRDHKAYEALAHVAGHIRMYEIMESLGKIQNSDDPYLRLLYFYALLKAGNLRRTEDLINLLLYENEVIFRKGVKLLSRLTSYQKRKIAHSLMPITQLEHLPKTALGKQLLGRMSALYEACDAYDEREYILGLVPVASFS